jgi:hypothetical protein
VLEANPNDPNQTDADARERHGRDVGIARQIL